MGVVLQEIIHSGYNHKYQSRLNIYQRGDPILFIRDTSNSSSSYGLPGNESVHSTVAITSGICAALFGVIVCWMWYFWKLQRAAIKSTAMRDPSKRLLRLEEIIPAQKFVEWRQQQYTQAMNSVALPSDDYCCAICISTILDEESVRGLPCNHSFHRLCLDQWFKRLKSSCPLCKGIFYTEDPDVKEWIMPSIV